MSDSDRKNCIDCSIANEVKDIHRGLYGDIVNKQAGLIQKVDCLIEYKPELKMIRRIRENFWKIFLSLITGVSISVISAYIVWTYVK